MPALCTLYTAGYTGSTPEKLLAAAERLKALIVDVRLMPYSKWAPHWNKKALIETWGDRYVHVEALGNLNYKGDMGEGVIVLKDAETGTTHLARLLADQPAIILCACKDHHKCHRSTVAQEMGERYNVQVVHLSGSDLELPGENGGLLEQMMLF